MSLKSVYPSRSSVDWHGFCVLGALSIVVSSVLVIGYLAVAPL